MALALILSPVVVPGLVSVRRPLPSVFQNSVDHRFADKDAQIHDQECIHRPAETQCKDQVQETGNVSVIKKQLLNESLIIHLNCAVKEMRDVSRTFLQQSVSEI